jgi:hypothetical protein
VLALVRLDSEKPRKEIEGGGLTDPISRVLSDLSSVVLNSTTLPIIEGECSPLIPIATFFCW